MSKNDIPVLAKSEMIYFLAMLGAALGLGQIPWAHLNPLIYMIVVKESVKVEIKSNRPKNVDPWIEFHRVTPDCSNQSWSIYSKLRYIQSSKIFVKNILTDQRQELFAFIIILYV